MPIILDGTAGVTNNATDLNYTGTLTGGTGVVNLGSGQVFKDASGNVGIGTSSPASAVTVFRTSAPANPIGSVLNSAARLQTAAASFNEKAEIQFQAGGTAANTGEVIAAISSLYTTFNGANNAGGDLLFSTRLSTAAGGLSERMRIDSSGNLMVGLTSAFAAAFATAKISTTSTNAVQFAASHNNSTGQVFFSNGMAAASTNWIHFYGVSSNNSIQNVIIYGNGNITNANNSYGALSDIKLKENIVDASPKLEKLDQVRVVSYNLKGDYEQHKQLGVIAQELENIFPGMVEETPDRDAESNHLGTTTKSVKYSVFVPMLIKAIQELKAIVDTQAARITALEAK